MNPCAVIQQQPVDKKVFLTWAAQTKVIKGTQVIYCHKFFPVICFVSLERNQKYIMPIKNLQRRRNQGISIKDIASVELTFIDRFNAVSFQITAKPDVIQKITCDSAQIQFPSENLAEIKLPKGQKFYIGDDIYLRLNGIEIQTKGKQSSAKRKVAFIKVVFPEGIEVNSMSFYPGS